MYFYYNVSESLKFYQARTVESAARSVKWQLLAIVDSNFAAGAANWRTRRNIRIVFDSGPLAPLCET